ncbi:ribonuclease H-like domain-containing protein [Tanacetum coccineum]
MGSSRALGLGFGGLCTHVRFAHSRCDSSLFIYRKGTIASLHKEFSMTDLGSLNYFLVIFVMCDSSGMFLSLRKYAIEILEWPHMVSCNPSRTPVDTESKLGNVADLISSLMLYQRLAGSLQYLTFTRPDISYAV